MAVGVRRGGAESYRHHLPRSRRGGEGDVERVRAPPVVWSSGSSGGSREPWASFVAWTDIMSQACKAQPPAVLWGTVHLQSYLKGLLLSRQKFVMDYSPAKGAKRKMLTMWEPTKSFDVRKRFSYFKFCKP